MLLQNYIIFSPFLSQCTDTINLKYFDSVLRFSKIDNIGKTLKRLGNVSTNTLIILIS